MDRQTALDRLRRREPELRALGVQALSLFGSVARDEAGPASDVDVAVTLDPDRPIGLFALAGIGTALTDAIGAKTDLVTEPVRKPGLAAEIERDRIRVF
jgi:predicted nucleotidyltransferase